MAVHSGQMRTLISDVLDYLNMNSKSAIELLMLTAANETKMGKYLVQLNNGPAEGMFQMLPSTEDDIWDTYVHRKIHLLYKLKAILPLENVIPKVSFLKTNLTYQICMVRIYYYRFPEKLPEADNVYELARYYKQYYNTHLGKATIEEAIDNYKKYCF